MASKTICRSCLRNLHHQVRANHHRPVAVFSSCVQQSPRQTLLKNTHEIRKGYASAATATPPAAGTAGSASETTDDSSLSLFNQYDVSGSTEAIFKECASQADYIVPQAFDRKGNIPKSSAGEDLGEGNGWWYEKLGLTPTFNTWAQVTMLHLYLLTARIRYFPPDHSKMWQQQLHDHYFYEAEHRMTIFHGMTARSIRNRNLKDLYNQWRGVLGAYDEGLIKGDAVLGTAIWRNIFKADEQVDWRDVAVVTSFMRRGLRALDKATDRTILSASVRFGSPINEKAIVLKPSQGMSKLFANDDEASVSDLLEGKTSAS